MFRSFAVLVIVALALALVVGCEGVSKETPKKKTSNGEVNFQEAKEVLDALRHVHGRLLLVKSALPTEQQKHLGEVGVLLYEYEDAFFESSVVRAEPRFRKHLQKLRVYWGAYRLKEALSELRRIDVRQKFRTLWANGVELRERAMLGKASELEIEAFLIQVRDAKRALGVSG